MYYVQLKCNVIVSILDLWEDGGGKENMNITINVGFVNKDQFLKIQNNNFKFNKKQYDTIRIYIENLLTPKIFDGLEYTAGYLSNFLVTNENLKTTLCFCNLS
jgi:hypothetical protein